MKRLLLSQGRTGSLNLTRYIRESNLDVRVYREPFNTTAVKDTNVSFSLNDILYTKNSFVENKIAKGSLPIDLQTLSTDELISFFNSKFDTIAILMRKDMVAQTESVLNAKLTNNWNSKYVYKNVDIELFPEFKTLLKDEEIQLKYISKKYNIPLFYYEDLYLENQKENVENFCNYFNIKFDENIMLKHMNINNKYRMDSLQKKLL